MTGGMRILITGATSGLGRQVAAELAAAGHEVVAHGRDPGRLTRLHDELGVDTVRADLAELAQVDRLAGEVLDRYDRLDVLVNNAGVGAGADRHRREVSADGIELRLAVNHLAGHLLTRRLLPLLTASAPARVVDVASVGQQAIDFGDPQLTRGYEGMRAYCQSKLAQVMDAVDLAGQLAGSGVTVNALHPASMMPTTMVREAGGPVLSTVEEGAAAVLRLVTDPALDGVSGSYFDGADPRPARANPQAYDAGARRELRVLSEDLVAAALARGARERP